MIIVDGNISIRNQSYDFKTGRIAVQHGQTIIDLFYKKDSKLGILLSKDYDKDVIFEEGNISGINEKGEEIEITGLRFLHISYDSNPNCSLQCHKSIKTFSKEDSKSNFSMESSVNAIEIEGFSIRHRSHTVLKEMDPNTFHEFRFSKDYNNTSAPLLIKDERFNAFHGGLRLKFQKIKNFNNELIFLESNITPKVDLKYELYQTVRNELELFLSFINGATVKIRREYIGRYISRTDLFSDIITEYSFPTIENSEYNPYIPIRIPGNEYDNVMYNLFQAFPKFVEINNTYNLKPTIELLNDTNNAITLQQRFYALMVGLESISKKHMNLTNDGKDEIIENETLNDFIETALVRLKSNKKEFDKLELYGKLENTIRSFKRKRKNSTYKIFKLIEFAGIEMTEEVNTLISKYRHKSVHEGDIGKTKMEQRKNYIILDSLLRNIVLNLIEYKGETLKYGY